MPEPRLYGGGSREGGLKTAAILKKRDPDYYKKVGRKGGLTPKTKPSGFAAMPRAKVIAAGKKGGKMSSRKGVKHGEGKSPVSTYYRKHKEPTAYELYTDPETKQ